MMVGGMRRGVLVVWVLAVLAALMPTAAAASPSATGPDGPAVFTDDTGSLRVTTSPPVPAEILVDGVVRSQWGLTWLTLPAGTYEVSFGDVVGFTTPEPQLVEVPAGGVGEFVGEFAQRGSLQVTTSPALPSTIFVDGVPRQEWGLWADVAPGEHEVCWGEVEGFAPPDCVIASVTAGATTTVSGEFTADPEVPGPSGHGWLRVVTDDGSGGGLPAMVSVDGLERDRWGLVWLKLAPGTYEVAFSGLEAFGTPEPTTVEIVEGATTEITGTFERYGTLRVTTDPPAPSTISVDGVPRDNWGLWTHLPPGDRQVCFSPVGGFVLAPGCQTATVEAGGLVEVSAGVVETLIPASTRVLDQAELAALVSFDRAAGQAIFDAATVPADHFGVGDVLVGGPSNAEPEGFLVEVLASEAAGGSTVVTVDQAGLVDAIHQAAVTATVPVTAEMVEVEILDPATSIAVVDEPVGLDAEARQRLTGDARSTAELLQLNIAREAKWGGAEASIDYLLSWGVKADLDIACVGNVVLGFCTDREFRGFEVGLVMADTLTAKTSIDANVSIAHEQELAEITSRVPFAVGFVPVWITITKSLKLTADGSVSVEILDWEMESSTTSTTGLRWGHTAGWEGVSEKDTEYSVSSDIADLGLPTVDAQASVRVTPRIEVLLYGLIGPYLEFDIAPFDLTAKIDDDDEVTLGWFASLTARAGLDLGALADPVVWSRLKKLGFDIDLSSPGLSNLIPSAEGTIEANLLAWYWPDHDEPTSPAFFDHPTAPAVPPGDWDDGWAEAPVVYLAPVSSSRMTYPPTPDPGCDLAALDCDRDGVPVTLGLGDATGTPIDEGLSGTTTVPIDTDRLARFDDVGLAEHVPCGTYTLLATIDNPDYLRPGLRMWRPFTEQFVTRSETFVHHGSEEQGCNISAVPHPDEVRLGWPAFADLEENEELVGYRVYRHTGPDGDPLDDEATEPYAVIGDTAGSGPCELADPTVPGPRCHRWTDPDAAAAEARHVYVVKACVALAPPEGEDPPDEAAPCPLDPDTELTEHRLAGVGRTLRAPDLVDAGPQLAWPPIDDEQQPAGYRLYHCLPYDDYSWHPVTARTADGDPDPYPGECHGLRVSTSTFDNRHVASDPCSFATAGEAVQADWRWGTYGPPDAQPVPDCGVHPKPQGEGFSGQRYSRPELLEAGGRDGVYVDLPGAQDIFEIGDRADCVPGDCDQERARAQGRYWVTALDAAGNESPLSPVVDLGPARESYVVSSFAWGLEPEARSSGLPAALSHVSGTAETPVVDVTEAEGEAVVHLRLAFASGSLHDYESQQWVTYGPPGCDTTWTLTCEYLSDLSSRRISGDAQDGVYELRFPIARWGPSTTMVPISLELYPHWESAIPPIVLDSQTMLDAGVPGFEVVSIPDADAATLDALGITTSSVDISDDAQQVTVEVSATDDVSGVASILVTLAAPSVDDDFCSWCQPSGPAKFAQSQVWIDEPEQLEVDEALELTIPRWAETGTWRVYQVTVRDHAGNFRSLDADELADAGLGATVEVTGSSDDEGPQPQSLSFEPATVDITDADQTITVSLTATDDVSGLADQHTPLLQLTPTGGLAGGSVFAQLELTDPETGTYTGEATFPRGISTGSWVVHNLELRDQAGNVSEWTSADLATLGIEPALTVTGTSDLEPPTLESVVVDTPTVDITGSAQTVTVSVGASDAGTGVTGGQVRLSAPDSPSASVWADLEVVSTEGDDAMLVAQVQLPRWSPTGTWTVSSVTVRDGAGNHFSASEATFGTFCTTPNGFPRYIICYPLADHVAGAFDPEVEVTGDGDFSAPDLEALTISPTDVDVSDVDGSFTVDVEISDDTSGLRRAVVWLSSPTGPDLRYSVDVDAVEPPETSATLSFSATVPAGSPAGVYEVSYVRLLDHYGRSRNYSAAQLDAAGLDAGVNIVGAIDTSPPTLTSLVMPDATPTTPGRAAVRTVQLGISDDLAGLMDSTSAGLWGEHGSWLDLTRPDGTPMRAYVTSDRHRLSGSATDGEFAARVVVFDGEVGEFLINQARLVDRAGNEVVLEAADLAGAGLPTSFVVPGV